MQNRYVGDLGDFGKYGLLNSLCQSDNLSLGVIWYLIPDESHNDDGKHINYLNPTKENINSFRICDNSLYDKLGLIVKNNGRNVSYIEQNGVLPINTVFYSDFLSYHNMPSIGPSARKMRLDHRTNWFDKAFNATSSCDLVFLDPDNGLEVPSVSSHNIKGPKYVYYDEIIPFINRKQSLVIYHHICRNGSAQQQISERLNQLKDKISSDVKPFTLLYRRGTLRAFFILPAPEHHDSLLHRAKMMANEFPWSQHFELHL